MSESHKIKLYVKISSENRVSGAWFYDKQLALEQAKPWEYVVPIIVDLADDIAHGPPLSKTRTVAKSKQR